MESLRAFHKHISFLQYYIFNIWIYQALDSEMLSLCYNFTCVKNEEIVLNICSTLGRIEQLFVSNYVLTLSQSSWFNMISPTLKE